MDSILTQLAAYGFIQYIFFILGIVLSGCSIRLLLGMFMTKKIKTTTWNVVKLATVAAIAALSLKMFIEIPKYLPKTGSEEVNSESVEDHQPAKRIKIQKNDAIEHKSTSPLKDAEATYEENRKDNSKAKADFIKNTQ